MAECCESCIQNHSDSRCDGFDAEGREICCGCGRLLDGEPELSQIGVLDWSTEARQDYADLAQRIEDERGPA